MPAGRGSYNIMEKKNSIIIGISSGIAAYKILDLIKILRERDCEIYVIMTEKASKMVSPSEFEKVSGHQVYINLFPERFDYREVVKKREVEHIKLANNASILVVAPATANIIGKITAGIADDFLTTTILATEAPVLLCPAMNMHMWNNPVFQQNLNKIKKVGFKILSPGVGRLACGYDGVGRLPEPEAIAQEIFYLLERRNRLKGKKIIVTAGGTSEAIDAVRVITNRASGKMGLALAEECFSQGADVLLLRSQSSVSSRYIIKEEIFETTRNLEELIKKHVKDYDVLFHTAAVSDFIPEKIIDKKLDSKKKVVLKLRPVVKILHQIKSWNRKIKLIGFKAVYKEKEKDLIKIGLQKLKDSSSDFIIVNDVGKEGVGFGVDTNEVYIISPTGLLAKIEKAEKKEIARKILDNIFNF